MANEYNSMGAGGGADAPPAAAPESADKNTVMLSAGNFPEGMVPKEGDKLTFCVTSAPDSEGNVAGYFEGGGDGKGDGDDWEAGFRKEMSPMAGQTEAS